MGAPGNFGICLNGHLAFYFEEHLAVWTKQMLEDLCKKEKFPCPKCGNKLVMKGSHYGIIGDCYDGKIFKVVTDDEGTIFVVVEKDGKLLTENKNRTILLLVSNIVKQECGEEVSDLYLTIIGEFVEAIIKKE